MQSLEIMPGRSIRRVAVVSFGAFAALLAAGLVSTPGFAQRIQRIAAIVNDDVVSQYDLQARMHVVIASSGLRPSAQLQQQIGQQVLRNLIDERLQMQEAKKKSISVTQRDLKEAITRIEMQNRLPRGSFDEFLKKNGMPREALIDQFRAQIAWNKLIRRVLLPRITVGDDEIEDILNRLKQRKGETEFRVSEIFLTIDQTSAAQDVMRTAQRLVEELRGGANFASVARQFSRTASAAAGGDLGWIQETTMNDDFRKVVVPLTKGTITDPIATPGGVQILSLVDKRRVLTGNPDDAVVELQQILLPVRNGASIEDTNVQVNLAQILSDAVSGCADHLKAAAESGSVGKPKLGTLRLRDLSGKIKAAVADLPVGKASMPIRIEQGVAVFMVCSRKEPEGSLPTREEIANRLRQERVDVMARQYLRDLRAAAIVDLRV